MGKKSKTKKKNLQKKVEQTHQSIAESLRQRMNDFNLKNYNESIDMMDQIDSLPLGEQKQIIRTTLQNMGTDCILNDEDPMGDGDQSLINTRSNRDKARKMYSVGGDIHGHLVANTIAETSHLCLVGSSSAFQTMVNKEVSNGNIKQPYSRCSNMKKMLETRETSMRLSPLLLIVSAGKNVQLPGIGISGQVQTAKLLLQYGARPDAKDVLGKTVCHYGAGAMGTEMTMKVVDMCIRAAQTSYLHGKEAELHGLKTADMNGLRGVVGGFNTDTNRRAIYLEEMGKEYWIKPENMRLVPPNTTPKTIVNLVDVQDRLGTVALHEVIIQDRIDVGEFLVNTHEASVHIADLDGMTPIKMASLGGMLKSGVCKMVMDSSRKVASQDRKMKKSICSNCQKVLDEERKKTCSGCKIAVYCGVECQTAHWKNGHKKECKKAVAKSAGVRVEASPGSMAGGHSFNFSTGKAFTCGKYRKPPGVGYNEKFVLKIQGNSEHSPLFVYDETRKCEFYIGPEQPGFREIWSEMRKERAWDGRKTFMKASFDEAGKCTIFPTTAGVKSKYSW